MSTYLLKGQSVYVNEPTNGPAGIQKQKPPTRWPLLLFLNITPIVYFTFVLRGVSMAACAAAKRAIGTLKAEQLT